MKFRNPIGPGAFVTAAFIGPGTLTVCTLAGVQFGYDLLWVLLFATVATIILQEMAARLGLVSQQGLGEALRSELKRPILRIVGLGIVFTAIILGNAAYEMGNITGTVIGLESTNFDHLFWGPILVGCSVFVVLWKENYRIIQNFMAALVFLMSLVFITTAIIVTNDFSELFKGFSPSLSSSNQIMALGLIGTTIVPYNLFLHASVVSHKWKNSNDLPFLRRETITTITLGGIISMCVLITATAMPGGMIQGVNDMAIQLEPLLGSYARIFLIVGLCSAGLSSAITAPLAAAITAKGIFGWSVKDTWKGRLVWGSVLLIGVSFSLLGFKPISIIQIAQVANAILLPIIVVFLMLMCNRTSIMGAWKNTVFQNALGVFVLAISLLISLRSFNSVFHFIE